MLSGFACLAIDYYQLKLLSSLLYINAFTMTSNRTNFDKESKLLDVLDKHIKEENCRHSPQELFEDYEIDDFLKKN
jgi:hypothetical protein